MTAPHVSRMTLIRARRIGRALVDMSLAPCAHDFRRPQELRADRQVIRPGSREIDAKPDMTVLLAECDDHAPRRRTVGHCENAAAFEGVDDLRQVWQLLGRDEQDLAVAQPCDIGIALDGKRMVAHGLAAHDLVQAAAEGIFAEHADHEGTVLLGQRAGWPLNEMREVEEEYGFELV